VGVRYNIGNKYKIMNVKRTKGVLEMRKNNIETNNKNHDFKHYWNEVIKVLIMTK